MTSMVRQTELLELLAETTPIEDIIDKSGVDPVVVLKWLVKEGHVDLYDFFDDFDEYE